jgi:hypothetical protein
MPIINRVSPSVFDAGPRSAGRRHGPEMFAMIEPISTIRTEKDVHEVLLADL